MTAGVYPFSRANTIGWASGERLTSAQMNAIDTNVAAAADGSLWSDEVIARTYIASSTAANHGKALLWSETYQAWFSFGSTGATPTPLAARLYVSDTALDTGPTVTTSAGLTPLCAAEGGSVMIFGGTPGSASAAKIRLGAASGDNWSAQSVNASGTEGVRCLAYHQPATLFVAGLDNSATTNIEVSSDGVTWTQRTGLPNSHPRGAMASSGAGGGRLVVLPYNTSTDRCLWTADTVTWTEATLPATQIWHSLYWDSTYGQFVALGATSVAYSSNGSSWSAATGSIGITPTYAAAVGRTVVYGGSCRWLSRCA